jgi:WD40 repeat protein
VLFADGSEGSLHICSFDPEHRCITLQKTLPHGMIDGVISPNGKLFAVIVSNDQIYDYKQDISVYDLKSLQLLHVFPQMTDDFYCLVAFSPDSQYMAICKTDGWVDLFSLASFDRIAQFVAHPGLFSDANDPIGGLAWSTTGYIATGGANVFEQDMKQADYTVKIWKVEEE